MVIKRIDVSWPFAEIMKIEVDGEEIYQGPHNRWATVLRERLFGYLADRVDKTLVKARERRLWKEARASGSYGTPATFHWAEEFIESDEWGRLFARPMTAWEAFRNKYDIPPSHPNCRCSSQPLDYYGIVAHARNVSREYAKAESHARAYGAGPLYFSGLWDGWTKNVPGLRSTGPFEFTVDFRPNEQWGNIVGNRLCEGRAVLSRNKEKHMKVKQNRFYVVPDGALLSQGGSFSTLKEAIAYASTRTNVDGLERAILQRVRVVRRKPQPVVVEKV